MTKKYTKEEWKQYMQNWRKKNPGKHYDKTYKERYEYMRKYYHKNKDRLAKRKAEYYLNNKDYFIKKCKDWYEKNKDKISQKAQILRKEVLKAYGNKCVCCGENTYEFLALDHKNNDGAKHRKEVKQAQSKIYKWAKENNYPSLLQILCHNCNLAKAFYGVCPHQKERTKDA